MLLSLHALLFNQLSSISSVGLLLPFPTTGQLNGALTISLFFVFCFVFSVRWGNCKLIVDCVLFIWRKIIVRMYRLWLHSLYGMHGLDVQCPRWAVELNYRKTSNIRRTLVVNNIVNHSDVVGASSVGAAPTTSSFSTWHLASRDSAKKAARQYENLLSVGIWCVLY